MTRRPSENVLNRRQLLSLDNAWHTERTPEPAADCLMRISRSAMACHFEVLVSSEKAHGVLATQECLDEVDRLESILSVFRPTSEVSLLNSAQAGDSVAVGSDLFELLKLCDRLQQETEGVFDITTGTLSQCWGFEERNPGLPAPQDLATARGRVGFQNLTLGQDCTVSVGLPGLRINLGGIGKGYALDRGASKISARGINAALLSAGYSSVLALGTAPGGAGWPVGLRHPVTKDKRMAIVHLRSCAIGTSGQEEQSFEAQGQQYGHILDPRTGFPPKEVLSVSVIANSAACADALATAFFVGGPDLANRYCQEHKDVAAVMLLASDVSRPIVIGSSDRADVEIVNE